MSNLYAVESSEDLAKSLRNLVRFNNGLFKSVGQKELFLQSKKFKDKRTEGQDLATLGAVLGHSNSDFEMYCKHSVAAYANVKEFFVQRRSVGDQTEWFLLDALGVLACFTLKKDRLAADYIRATPVGTTELVREPEDIKAPEHVFIEEFLSTQGSRIKDYAKVIQVKYFKSLDLHMTEMDIQGHRVLSWKPLLDKASGKPVEPGQRIWIDFKISSVKEKDGAKMVNVGRLFKVLVEA